MKLSSLSFLLICAILLSSGCASVQTRISQVEQYGSEKIYNYPYKKVFEACEAIPRYYGFLISKSNFEDGYLYLTYAAYPPSGTTIGISIKKIDENTTSIKIYLFHMLGKEGFYKNFFSRIDGELNR